MPDSPKFSSRALEASKHPLVVLLAATILGSAIVPFVNGRIARESRESELKLNRAMEALRSSATTERQINELQTEFMLFAKNDLWDNVQARREEQVDSTLCMGTSIGTPGGGTGSCYTK